MIWENLKSQIFSSNSSTFQIGSCQSFVTPENIKSIILDKLFERDSDDENLVSVITSVIKKCPLDLRKEVTGQICIVGGCAVIEPLVSRLEHELTMAFTLDQKLQNLKLVFRNSSFSPLVASWTGASVYSSLNGVGLTSKITLQEFERVEALG